MTNHKTSDFRARTKPVEFYRATAFTYARGPKAILRTKLLLYITGCCLILLSNMCIVLPK